MTRAERLDAAVRRSNTRAQRRFHAMVVERAYAVRDSRESRLYTQAERLMDRLIVEARWEATMGWLTAVQLADPEAPDLVALAMAERSRNEATWARFWSRHDGPTGHGAWTEGELQVGWGK